VEPHPPAVGAAPTGLSAALFLFERGVRCRIVDKAAVPTGNKHDRVGVSSARCLGTLDLKVQAIEDGLFVDVIFAGAAKTGNPVLLCQCPENALASATQPDRASQY
jgi:FAD binding domain